MALAGCASQPSLEVDYDPATAFSEYRTYAWHPNDPIDTTQLLRVFTPGQERLIRSKVDTHLTDAGFQRSARAEDADFIVRLTLGRRQDVTFDTISVPDYDSAVTVTRTRGRFEVQRGVYVSHGKKKIKTTEVYTEGSISLDVYDNATNAPVWSGHASAEVDPIQGLQRAREMAETTLERLLDRFPPR